MWVLEKKLKRKVVSAEVVEMGYLSLAFFFFFIFCQNEGSLDKKGGLLLNEMGKVLFSTPADRRGETAERRRETMKDGATVTENADKAIL